MSMANKTEKKSRLDLWSILFLTLTILFLAYLTTTIRVFTHADLHNLSLSRGEITLEQINTLHHGDHAYYLKGSENIASLVFVVIGLLASLAFLADLLIRKGVTHVFFVCLSLLILLAYGVYRAILGFRNGGLDVMGGVFYLIGSLGVACSLYLDVKKALDGDTDWKFHVAAIVGGIGIWFGAIHDYSLLDAYGQSSNVLYWGGYAASRLLLLLFVLAEFVSLTHDYDPDPLDLSASANRSDAVLGK